MYYQVSQFDIFSYTFIGLFLFKEARMAAKLLEKRFGIKDVRSWSNKLDINVNRSIFKVKEWLKDNDADNDGRLSYMEFKKSLKKFLNLGGDDGKEEENGE